MIGLSGMVSGMEASPVGGNGGATIVLASTTSSAVYEYMSWGIGGSNTDEVPVLGACSHRVTTTQSQPTVVSIGSHPPLGCQL